ncbi:hypothetical protein ACKI2N_025860 [Cupriavidus sp. 30B13]|uniref:hypothetical protein n=1 Tax=Cupriavidus sp. 30B13 TaxID=3384241 RepID=UPI003B92135A
MLAFRASHLQVGLLRQTGRGLDGAAQAFVQNLRARRCDQDRKDSMRRAMCQADLGRCPMLAALAPRCKAIHRERDSVARTPRIANKCQCAGICNMPTFDPRIFAYLAFT